MSIPHRYPQTSSGNYDTNQHTQWNEGSNLLGHTNTMWNLGQPPTQQNQQSLEPLIIRSATSAQLLHYHNSAYTQLLETSTHQKYEHEAKLEVSMRTIEDLRAEVARLHQEILEHRARAQDHVTAAPPALSQSAFQSSLQIPEAPAIRLLSDFDGYEVFWTHASWKAYCSREKSHGRSVKACGYLVQEDGTPVGAAELERISKSHKIALNTLYHYRNDPSSWSNKNETAKRYYYNYMGNHHPEFTLCANNWKIEEYATDHVPNWTRFRRDNPHKLTRAQPSIQSSNPKPRVKIESKPKQPVPVTGATSSKRPAPVDDSKRQIQKKPRVIELNSKENHDVYSASTSNTPPPLSSTLQVSTNIASPTTDSPSTLHTNNVSHTVAVNDTPLPSSSTLPSQAFSEPTDIASPMTDHLVIQMGDSGTVGVTPTTDTVLQTLDMVENNEVIKDLPPSDVTDKGDVIAEEVGVTIVAAVEQGVQPSQAPNRLSRLRNRRAVLSNIVIPPSKVPDATSSSSDTTVMVTEAPAPSRKGKEKAVDLPSPSSPAEPPVTAPVAAALPESGRPASKFIHPTVGMLTARNLYLEDYYAKGNARLTHAEYRTHWNDLTGATKLQFEFLSKSKKAELKKASK